MSKYGFMLFLLLLFGGGAILSLNMRDVNRNQFKTEFIIRSEKIGNVLIETGKGTIGKIINVLSDAKDYISSPLDKAEKELNEYFTSKFPYFDGNPLETEKWNSLNGFQKLWHYVKDYFL